MGPVFLHVAAIRWPSARSQFTSYKITAIPRQQIHSSTWCEGHSYQNVGLTSVHDSYSLLALTADATHDGGNYSTIGRHTPSVVGRVHNNFLLKYYFLLQKIK